MMNIRIRAKVFPVILAALGWQFQALALEPAVNSPGGAPEPAAGQVSMVLGGAWLDTPGEERRRISIGTQIGAGDFVQTEPNGHVHIRFIDNALVSVRPDSRLEIVRYEYNRANPSLSMVKFSLEEGVTRSISGDAASTARERFRLNTPIAAIGVRGTDFVVSATQDSVRALVNEGTIVLAPYSAECTAEAFGPCAVNAVELSGNSEQMLGFDIGSPAPEVLPAVHETNPDALRDDVNGAVDEATEAEEEISGANEAYLEGTAGDRVSASLANLNAGTSDPAPDPAPEPAPETAPTPEPDFTPEVPFGETENEQRQMVWGRWGAGKGDLERITYAYEAASAGRAVAVGNLEYALFRPDPEGSNVNSGLGTVDFDLAAAQAFYENGGNTVAMQVSDGELSINFDRNVFSTGLTLNHDLTGTVLFSADGRVYDGGFFRMNDNGQQVSGAVTLDGTEAGYRFLKLLEQGRVSGLTLWDAR
ncbi:MAG: FecR domain-containing protein [Gammaproteobacteria bacterium]|nr:FecR domain-containing protein [Gammaproteobacteria bacterium]MYE99742.1 FecR domain-containing protein [Gammaproteobacteria bacterium]